MSDKLTGADLEQALADRDLPSEGTADDKRAAVAAYDEEHGAPASSVLPAETRLNDDVTKPSTTAPGDGPADTTDPSETAHSVTPSPGPEAIAVGTVNAVVPGPKVEPAATVAAKDQRVEKYKATRPDGTEVTVTHNIDTGETSVS